MSSDSDFEVKVISVARQPKQQTNRGDKTMKRSRKVLSSDSDGSVVEVITKSPQKKGWSHSSERQC